MTLPDPDRCPTCGARSAVTDSRNEGRGYRRRRHVCLTCKTRWPTWETRINPKRLKPAPTIRSDSTR